MAAARRRWQDTQPLRDMRQYVFLDECGVSTDLLRRYGRSPRGTRLHDHTPCSHWQTHTVIAGLRVDGLTAPAVFDGPIDTPTFRAYVEQVLVPTLRLDGVTAPAVFDGPIDGPTFHAYVEQVLVPTLRPGDVVVLDNLAVHKQPEIRAAIEGAQARVHFLPPYSPDFNPIEQVLPN